MLLAMSDLVVFSAKSEALDHLLAGAFRFRTARTENRAAKRVIDVDLAAPRQDTRCMRLVERFVLATPPDLMGVEREEWEMERAWTDHLRERIRWHPELCVKESLPKEGYSRE